MINTTKLGVAGLAEIFTLGIIKASDVAQRMGADMEQAIPGAMNSSVTGERVMTTAELRKALGQDKNAGITDTTENDTVELVA